jgi:Ribosomal protein S3, C-terminal domain
MKIKYKIPYNTWKKPNHKSKIQSYLLKTQSTQFKKALYFFNISQKPVVSPHIWHNQWKNLHLIYKSLYISRLIQKFFLYDGLYVNKFYIHIIHGKIKILANSLGIFRPYKTKKKINKYMKKLNDKKPLSNLAKLLLEINKVSYVKLSFYHLYLPKILVQKNAIKVFKKHKKERFFWESLQLVYGVFKGYVSASILGSLIYTHTRRNPRRLAFIAYIKRLLDWHFRSLSYLQIQGVRIEVKGRFNAKSRAKKQIVSTGRVRMHEISSNVDYARIDAFTKFGCLGIKVWVCPK